MTGPEIQDPAVRSVIEDLSTSDRKTLLALRKLVFDASNDHPEIGPLVETLKWSQISYLPKKPRTGTTVRLALTGDPTHVAQVFFHCQTRLIPTFREHYPEQFTYGGNRSIDLTTGWRKNRAALRHCIGLALTYHLWK